MTGMVAEPRARGKRVPAPEWAGGSLCKDTIFALPDRVGPGQWLTPQAARGVASPNYSSPLAAYSRAAARDTVKRSRLRLALLDVVY